MQTSLLLISLSKISKVNIKFESSFNYINKNKKNIDKLGFIVVSNQSDQCIFEEF